VSGRARLRRFLPYLIAAAGGFLLAYLAVLFFILPTALVPDEGPVPDVVGLYYDDAVQRLQHQGFEGTKGESRYHATAPEGVVLEQSPPPDTRQPRGATVTMAISKGQLEAEVPRVVGLSRRQAQAALQNAGLELGDVQTRESDAPRGEVISMSPVAGTRVPIPTSVKIVVSTGPAEMDMPDLVGQSYPQARSLLEQLGLRPEPPEFDSLSYMPEYTVLSQSPGAGARVEPGARVTQRVAGRPPSTP
jgi:serine/threonine-protein kinase